MVFGFGKKKATKKKVVKKKAVKKKSVRKNVVKKKTTGKKKAFGGYSIDFNGRTETMEEVFGKKPIAPSAMTKIIWQYVKKKKLGGKR